MKPDGNNFIKPFWSWNDRLEKELLLRQIDNMKSAGIGGFFMHARGGLKTEYMSEEWFDMIKACIEKAEKEGMEAWGYDENGWPSGFADGAVPALGEDYCQKWLICEDYSPQKGYEGLLGFYKKQSGEWSPCDEEEAEIAISYGINRYYTDTFNRSAIRAFLDATHEKYYERFKEYFGGALKGFFTDEPQYGNMHWCPWSPYIAEKFEKDFGYSLIDKLPLLFYNDKGFEKFRARFYNTASTLFRESFIKQMYDWCDEHGCKLTGHMMNEDNLRSQLRSTGGVMSCYEHFHEPGVDWLGRAVAGPLMPKQLGSVAAQLCKKTLTEAFALCGWDVSLNELKWIAQWHMVNGVTAFCPHLEGYTLRGCRKRDYPASFQQLPWYNKAYPELSAYLGGLGALLDESRDYAPVLVIHALQSAYTEYNPFDFSAIDALDRRFDKILRDISDELIPHHYGDEIIMSRYGRTVGAELEIGKCRYKAVVLPALSNIKDSTLDLLCEFAQNGGRIYALEKMPRLCEGEGNERLQKLCSEIELLSEARILKEKLSDLCPIRLNCDINAAASIKITADGRELYYIVNYENNSAVAEIELSGERDLKLLDVASGEETELECRYIGGNTLLKLPLGIYGSAVLLAENGRAENKTDKKREVALPLSNDFEIAEVSKNSLTLDFCDYRIADGAWQGRIAVINLQNKLLELKKPCDIELKFSFCIAERFDFSTAELCLENPRQFKISVNGCPLEFCDNGEFFDSSVRKCRIGELLKMGENEIILSSEFYQSPKLYHILFDEGVHECELNKLTYDTELESIYIIGNFGVCMDGKYYEGERRCIHGGKKFSLTAPLKSVSLPDITRQGFWFFAGEMRLSQKIKLDKIPNIEYFVGLERLFAPAAEVFINGKSAGFLAFSPYKLKVTELLKNGENSVEIVLYSGNRNLLGPHHRPYGESYFVGPATFTDTPGWTEATAEAQWTDNYSFVLFGGELL